MAAKWYRKAADQGDASAQFALGLMYYNGQGVARDAALAVKWFRKSAEQGFASAQSNLGGMYARGAGVPKDLVVAYMWLDIEGRANGQRGALEKQMTPAQIAQAQKLSADWKSLRKWKLRSSDSAILTLKVPGTGILGNQLDVAGR